MTELDIAAMASRLADLPGVVGVALGGSRARGEHHPDSDFDLGIYYRAHLDTDRIDACARELTVGMARATDLGGWGPWVDGGAWLELDGVHVDLIYRDLDRVEESVARSLRGEFAFHHQLGHPLGVPDFAYAGELALARILEDRSGVLARIKDRVAHYPAALQRSVIDLVGQASFMVDGARKVVDRDDPSYLSGCLFTAFGLTAHAIHGAAGRWLLNEKGAIAASGRLPGAPADFVERVGSVMSGIGATVTERQRAVDEASAIIDAVGVALAR